MPIEHREQPLLVVGELALVVVDLSVLTVSGSAVAFSSCPFAFAHVGEGAVLNRLLGGGVTTTTHGRIDKLLVGSEGWVASGALHVSAGSPAP